jgi:hypothetical protein
MEAAVNRASLSTDDTYPADLLETLAPLVARPNDIDPALVKHFLGFDDAEVRRLLDEPYEMGSFLPEFKFVVQSDLSTLRMAEHVLDDGSFDVTSVYFTGIDTVSHLFWHFLKRRRRRAELALRGATRGRVGPGRSSAWVVENVSDR